KAIDALRQVSGLLDAKAPGDAAAFTAWLRQISQTTAEAANEVALRLRVIPGVRQVITARVGGPAHLIPNR
ncbi:MAG: hypothetical protein HGB05_19870, partial [Chloroflexi bacterium]|nr:hypothetical protein [Chloroflexota bacterium]